jgi:hypothetical protein
LDVEALARVQDRLVELDLLEAPLDLEALVHAGD